MTSLAGPADSLARPSTTWLTADRCRVAALAFAGLVVAAHILYLSYHCPIDLAEDEAYYWDWSRQLDISYFSKGPLVAWLIRAACVVVGDTPLGVRLPAILLGAGMALTVYRVTLRLFASDRLALAATLLSYLLPIFLAGRLIMTTDPPALLFWTLAMAAAHSAIFGGKRIAWAALGVIVGVGFLAKLSVPLFFVGVLIFLLTDSPSRRLLRTPWPYVGLVIALLFSAPVVVWNLRHGGATFFHISEDVGLACGVGAFQWENFLAFWLGQMIVAGPLLFLLIAVAVLWGLFSRGIAQEDRRPVRFLLAMSVPYFLIVLAASLRSHPAANWTAAAYPALVILATYFLATRWRQPECWRRWRGLLYPAIAINAALILAGHDSESLYPLVARWNQRFPSLCLTVKQVDPTRHIHGWAEVGQRVSADLRRMDSRTIILSQTYEWAALCAFYADGHPTTYVAGTYFRDLSQREPFNQYDFWPDRALDQETLKGRDALYIGMLTDDMRDAFDHIEPLPPIVIERGGLVVRRLYVWKGVGFKGMSRPGWDGRYNK